MRNRKYVFDIIDLQYKEIKVTREKKFIKGFLWFCLSVVIAIFYLAVFENIFGSPKEKILSQEADNIRLKFFLLDRNMNNSLAVINNLRLSDDKRYRPILEMDSIPSALRRPGYGGVDRTSRLVGLVNSEQLISYQSKLEMIKFMAKVQGESFRTISEKTAEWKREMEYLPMISPVNVNIRRGDGLKFREVHPVLGTPQWHHGQDFNTPYGTEVFATGAGTVVETGWHKTGFGNYVKIDHGYGFQTIYGHLSEIKVTEGLNVKRGDLVGLSGSSGTSSGPHLHYQIDLYGHYKNPLYYFNDDLTEEEYLEMIKTLSSKSNFR
jgi:murein DD-endopeptidase MepM/ murein hydrolase activator NlpD